MYRSAHSSIEFDHYPLRIARPKEGMGLFFFYVIPARSIAQIVSPAAEADGSFAVLSAVGRIDLLAACLTAFSGKVFTGGASAAAAVSTTIAPTSVPPWPRRVTE
jgi:hypothetical protein